MNPRVDWTRNLKDQYLLIELTDCCNLRCPMCSHSRAEAPHGDKIGFMDFSLYKKILTEITPKNKPMAWKLFWLGESLLHPQIDKILYFTYGKIKDLSRQEYIDLHTNGLLMTPEITEVLLDMNYKLPRLTLSIDAATEETYQKVRRGGDYNILLKNIEYFLKRRKERGQIFPTLIFQFIVMGANAHEAEKFVYFWIEKLNELYRGLPDSFIHTDIKDTIWLKREDVPLSWKEKAENLYRETIQRFNLKPKKEKHYELVVSVTNLWDKTEKKQFPLPGRFPCSGPFKTPSIKWDGELTVCCFDPTFELSLGNLKESSFSDLWFSPRADFIRKSMIEDRFSDIKTASSWAKCQDCPALDTPDLNIREVVEYLEAIGEKELALKFLEKWEGQIW